MLVFVPIGYKKQQQIISKYKLTGGTDNGRNDDRGSNSRA